jgi:hypothetical protein
MPVKTKRSAEKADLFVFTGMKNYYLVLPLPHAAAGLPVIRANGRAQSIILAIIISKEATYYL